MSTANPQQHADHRRRIPAALRNRIAFLIPFVVAGAGVWLGIARMRTVLRESAALSRNLATLLEQLDVGDRDTRESDVDALDSRVRTIQETWVHEVSDVERWISEMSQTATLQGWKLRHEPGPIESRDAAGLTVTSVTVLLNLQPASGTDAKTLIQLLQIADAATHTSLHPDLNELSVAAAETGIIEAKMAIRFWTLPEAR